MNCRSRPPCRRRALLAPLAAAALTLAACASDPAPTAATEPVPADPSRGVAVAASIPASSYAGGSDGDGGVFDVSRDVLREYGFLLERVDANMGVISTKPKANAGFFTLWHTEHTSAKEELDDAVNRQQRTVRITFEPVTASPSTADPGDSSASAEPASSGAPPDLRNLVANSPDAQLLMTIRVIVEREYRPGWRVNSKSVRLSSYTVDTDLRDRGISYRYEVPREDDQALAREIQAKILARTGTTVHAAQIE